MVRIEKPYVFEGPSGKPDALLDLFDGRRQLIVYHFMFDPSWSEGCKSCSFFADTFNGAILHLRGRDTAFAAISRAPLEKLAAFQRRMGWSFPWYLLGRVRLQLRLPRDASRPTTGRAGRTEYNYVVQEVSPSRRRPGRSIFLRDGDEVFHTYSTYARGLDHLIVTYNLLDPDAARRGTRRVCPTRCRGCAITTGMRDGFR